MSTGVIHHGNAGLQMIAAYLSEISERAHGGWVHGLGEFLLNEAQQLLLQLLHLSGMPSLSASSRAKSGSEVC